MTYRDTGAQMAALTRWPIARLSVSVLPALVLFCIGAMTDIALPGVYMDAVNPDYVVVRLLNPHPARIDTWQVPGTLLFGRFPVIGNIYHGALPYYVGLPFYALFGTGVVGIRLTNMVFGLLVIAGTGAFMLAFGTRTLICALCLALLALDPGFLFSFRTQFYITLLPVAALMASAALTEARSQTPTRLVVIVAGLLAGIACYGYFIYGFLVPAVALFALSRWHRLLATRTLIRWWAGGFLLGVLPYVFGFLLMLLANGSLRRFIEYLRGALQALAPGSSGLTVWERLRFFIDLVRNTIIDVGPTSMMLKSIVALEMPDLKIALLLVLPGAAIMTGLARPSRVRGLLLLLGMLLGFLVLVLTFGGRLWLHHAALLLPLLYAALALGLERLASLLAPYHRWRADLIVTLITAPFLIANASDRQAVFLQLEATGGVDLFSDGIDRYAEASLRDAPAAYRFFPDWGVFMSFAMLTRGSIPYSTGFSPAAARAVLCAGHDAELAAMADQPEQRLQDWITAVGWGRYERLRYDQGNGKPLLDVVRWHVKDQPSSVCP